MARNSRNSSRHQQESSHNNKMDHSIKKSVSREKPSEDSGFNASWMGSKESLHNRTGAQVKIDLSRYAAKPKNSTPLDSNRTNKPSNSSLEVREFDRIPTIVDRFEKRREVSDLMVSQLGKYDLNNDRINSFRNKCKEYENSKMSSSRPTIDDINATRKMTAPTGESEISEIKIAQNISRTKMRNGSNELNGTKEMNVSDLQFLFSKKLSNVDKLSLLKLKKKKQESSSSRIHTDHVQSNYKDTFLKEKSNSNFHNGEKKSSARGIGGSNLRDSQKSYNRESSDYIAQKSRLPTSSRDQDMESHNISITPRKEISSKPIVVYQKSQKEKDIAELTRKGDSREEKEKKIRELELRLKGKRSSVPEENEADKMAKEFDFNIDMRKISMTPDISRRGSLDQIPRRNNEQEPKKELDLNSRLILNTLISEVGKTEEQYLETLEFERRNLIEYIKNGFETTGKVPRTTLQFYKVIAIL